MSSVQKLYLHCGLAKTGTTSIQRYFSSERERLRTRGIEYPEIGLNLSGIAHHKIADQLVSKADFDINSGPVGEVLDFLAAPDRLPTAVLSSEGFANCLYNRRTRSCFLAFLNSARKLNNVVFVVFRVRPFGQYFDSWYLQRLKVGAVPLDIDVYVKESLRWVKNYFRSLMALKDAIGVERIIIIDAHEGNGDAVSALLARIGLADQTSDQTTERYNERLGLKKAALLSQLQQLVDADKTLLTSEIVPLRSAIVRMNEFPTDIFRYRVIPFTDFNKIQLAAHKYAMPFLRPLVAQAIEPEPEFYDAVSLSRTELSAEDKAFVSESLPQEFQSSRLMELWRKSPAATGLKNRRSGRGKGGFARRLVPTPAK